MKKYFFLFGILILFSLFFLAKTDVVNAGVVPPCGTGVCNPQDTSMGCYGGIIQESMCYNCGIQPCTGFKGCWGAPGGNFGSCTPTPAPTPSCAYACCYDTQCASGSCDTSVHACRHRICSSGACVFASGDGTNACTSGADCPTVCTPGTGTTNASCGGDQNVCKCNGTAICATQGYVCSNNSCVPAWSAGHDCGALTNCPSGSICNPGGGSPPTTPPSTPTPTGPATCQQCMADAGGNLSCSTLQNLGGGPCTTDCTACPGGGGPPGGGGCTGGPRVTESIKGSIAQPPGGMSFNTAGILMTQTGSDNFYLNLNNLCGANYKIQSVGVNFSTKDYSNTSWQCGNTAGTSTQLACPTAISQCEADGIPAANCVIKSYGDQFYNSPCANGAPGNIYMSSCTVTGTKPQPLPALNRCTTGGISSTCNVNGNGAPAGKTYYAVVTSNNQDFSVGGNTQTFSLYAAITGAPEALNFTCNMLTIAGFTFPAINLSFAPFGGGTYCAYANDNYANPLGCYPAQYSGGNQTNPQTMAVNMPSSGTYNFKVLGWNNMGPFGINQYVLAPGMAVANNITVDSVAATCVTPTPTPSPTPPPTYSISGNVWVDSNKNGFIDVGENNYTGGVTITSSNGGAITYPSSGAFNVAGLTAGTYTISYTSLPNGYTMTNPVNGPPPSFTVTVGTGCSVGGSNSAACDASNNITNLNFGINAAAVPWIQIVGGGDVGGTGGINTGGTGTTGGSGTGGTGSSGGFDNPIPLSADVNSCNGPYSSVPGTTSTTPGLIFTGNGSAYFGQGSASLNNWLVGGTNYPESFGPINQGGVVKTSYSYLQSIAKQAGIPLTDILPYCGLGGLSGCDLSSSTLPNGIYITNGNLTLTGSTYTFPSNKNYIILIGKNPDGSNGNLTIQTKLLVPNGSTVLFSASGNITVDKSIGEAAYTTACVPPTVSGGVSTGCSIEGIFSADQNFVVDGQNDCTIGPDLKLNVAGSIVTNAALGGGTFKNLRDLCAGNAYCPVFTVTSRPDFILNAPDFIKKASYTWQELAP